MAFDATLLQPVDETKKGGFDPSLLAPADSASAASSLSADSNIPQLSQYNPTLTQRAGDALSSIRKSGPVEAVLGKTPDETAQMFEPRSTGLLPNVVKAAKDIPAVAELSPTSLVGKPTDIVGGITKDALSQINLENLAMVTGIGEVWKAAKLAKDTPKIAALTKALVGAYFTSQGAKGAADIAGKVAGNPNEPAGELGEDIGNIGLNSLMAFAPAGEAILSGKVKPFDRSKIPFSGSTLNTPKGALPPEQPTTTGEQNAIPEKPKEPGQPAGGQPDIQQLEAGAEGKVEQQPQQRPADEARGGTAVPELRQLSGQAVNPPTINSPHELVPALQVGDKVFTGGKNHDEVLLKNSLAAAKSGDMETPTAISKAHGEDANHVFVKLDSNGKQEGRPLTRREAADALGEKDPLQSARLNELKKPKGNWKVVVNAPMGDFKGSIQLVDVNEKNERAGKITPEGLRAAGHDVPDFSKLPQGSYTWDEAVKKLKESPATKAGSSTPQPVVEPTKNAPFVRETAAGQSSDLTESQPLDPQTGLPIKRSAAPKQKMTALGADVAGGEFPKGQGSPTAMKYRLIDQERQQRGLEPLAKPAGVSDQTVMDKAMAEVDRDPSLPEKLVSELNSKPRSIDAWERMVLLLHKIDLRHEFEKSAHDAAQAFDDSKEFPDRRADMVAANLRTARISDQLTELEKASRVSGSEQGRGLRALQIMANEDYSLASLETQRRAAKGGEPLTDAERAELKKVADDYKKANDELQQHLDRSKASESEANRRLDEILKQPKPEPIAPHIRALADKIITSIEGQAKSARERIKARRAEGRLMAGLDPTDLADHAIVGAEYFAHGIRDFAEWSKNMASEFGDYVKPHLQQIFDASIKKENAEIGGTPEQKARVRKAVKSMTAAERQTRVEDAIKKKFSNGQKDSISGDVQRLAKTLVEGGIKDREKLIDAVHEILSGIDPSITRREAMDAISGYGDFKQLSKDEISVRLRGMKGEMQQIAKLQDMAAGVPPSKTGIERRTPTDAERKLIKAVNEAKIKFQVPITDPATQLKSALDTRKIQLQNQINDMQEKIASGDFSKAPRRELVLDRRAQELQAQKERIAKKFKLEQSNYQKANAPKTSKFFDFISNVRRFAVLSGVNVVGKLAAYSATKLPTIGAAEAIGGALGKIPGVSKVLEKAPSEGGFQVKALSQAVAKGLTQGFVDAYKTAKTGQSDLRAAFSNRMESGREWYNFFQTVHEVVKSPLRRTAFELSLAKRMEFAAKNGADITDPMTQLALSKDAYLDSDRALLLENNRLASGIRGLFRQLETKDKKTGQVPLSGKIAATAGRVEFPILSVPLNYVKQTMTAAFGLASGSVKLRRAFANGIENLKPEEADAIARHLKYGTIGGAALLWGFIDGYNNGANGTFGGFYQPGEKRKENQAGVGGIRVAGHNIPGLLLHNPVIAVANMGHMMGAIMASKLNKKTDQTHSLPVAVAAGLMGLINQSPLGNTTELATQLSDPRSSEWAMGEHIKGLVDPQLSQEIAQWMDRNGGKPVKREPKTILQHVETGIPGLRKNVPEKKK